MFHTNEAMYRIEDLRSNKATIIVKYYEIILLSRELFFLYLYDQDVKSNPRSVSFNK